MRESEVNRMLKKILNATLNLVFKFILVYLITIYGIPLYIKALSNMLG